MFPREDNQFILYMNDNNHVSLYAIVTETKML